MASPDLDAPARVSCLSAAKSPSGSKYSCVPAILISSVVLFGAAQCRAQAQPEQDQENQDVAGAARQERAHKEKQQKKSKHIYTAEDLKREHILTPEDRAELEARKNQPSPAPAHTQQPQDAVTGSAVAQDFNRSA